MDERFAYLEEWAERAVGIERNFSLALIGSKEGAISLARGGIPMLGRMVEAAEHNFSEALAVRQMTLEAVCRAIVEESHSLASGIISDQLSKDNRIVSENQLKHTLARLKQDAESRVSRYQLDMKRIAIVARSMRDDNKWDVSAALLRARESVEKTSTLSRDALGRKQLTARYTKLLVRGLGLSTLTDSVVMSSAATKFDVFDFDGTWVRSLDGVDYETHRETLFHPQATRYLALLRK